MLCGGGGTKTIVKEQTHPAPVVGFQPSQPGDSEELGAFFKAAKHSSGCRHLKTNPEFWSVWLNGRINKQKDK